MTQKEFFLCPVIHIWAEDEAEATDKVIEAIFTARVGEIPAWGTPPPSFEERRLQQAAPELLAALEGFIRCMEALPSGPDRAVWLSGGFLDGCVTGARAAIAKATSPEARELNDQVDRSTW